MQRVLDLDLDVFVRPLKSFCKETDERAPSEIHSPMPRTEIENYLHSALKLSPRSPIPGLVTDLHKDVYWSWRDLIQTGHLQVPFEVVHVDGHADLGMGDATHVSIQEEWIHTENKFTDPPVGGYTGLGSGNYLTFAISNSWISRLDYVCHEEEPDDLPASIFKDWDTSTSQIELRYLEKGAFDDVHDSSGYSRINYERSIVIPFSRTPLPEYTAPLPFDFAFVARSPSYTPVELDFANDLVLECLSALPS